LRHRPKTNKNLIVCPKSKQYTDIIVCAANCDRKRYCEIYRERISLEILQEFIENHPNYILVGELIPSKTNKPKETTFWVVTGENEFTEVTESEVMKNPQNYIDKQIWQKPPYKYEVVVTLKRIKVD